MAKIRPIDDRLTTLVDDEEFDDFYRPENPASSRAPRRVSQNGASQGASMNAGSRSRVPASSTSDFADPIARSRSRRARAAMLQDGFEDDYEAGDKYDDDYEHDEEAPSPRSRRRVATSRSARRKSLLASKWGRIGLALALLAILGVLTSAFLLVRGFFLHDARFRIDGASSIQILGNSRISHADLLNVFGPDLGHDIFTVPLATRRAELQQLPWVQSAIVMRLLPNQLRVSIVERVPAAFVREGNSISLVDASGVILSMPPSMLAARHYSFPVVVGVNTNEPPETRADRMQLYEKFVTELDSTATVTAPGKNAPTHPAFDTAPKVSQQLSEVDVSDPEDVRALMPSAGTDILVHFGDQDFANRYRIYQQHLPQWRLQYPHLAAVDLRYDRQTVLQMSKVQDPSSAGDAVDTTPTLAATPAIPHVVPRTLPSARPSAATHIAKPAVIRKPTAAAKAPVRTSAKSIRPKAPTYVQPFDNPHLKPASVSRPTTSSIHG